jgi:Raf kinase inhibitor-like YbhB/YbcL family protein
MRCEMALFPCDWPVAVLALVLLGLSAVGAAAGVGGGNAGPPALRVTSPAFSNGSSIPDRHACGGANVSPQLDWSDPPQGAKSFALVVSDPDAQAVAGYTWLHWIVYGLPPELRGLPEAFESRSASVPGVRFGKTHFGNTCYGGPCPPRGPAHRYYFTLYAVDVMPDLKDGATADALMAAIKGHVLAEGELAGTYARR